MMIIARGYLNPCTPTSFSDAELHELPPKLFLTRNFERQLMNQTKTKNKQPSTLNSDQNLPLAQRSSLLRCEQ